MRTNCSVISFEDYALLSFRPEKKQTKGRQRRVRRPEQDSLDSSTLLSLYSSRPGSQSKTKCIEIVGLKKGICTMSHTYSIDRMVTE